MANTSSGARVVVVGAGLGGLACAALLAKRGARVEVLESAKQVGGLARSRDLHGFTFNRGAHALYRGGAAARVLQELGVLVRGRAPALRGVAVYQGREHPLPATPWSMLTSGLLTWSARVTLARVFTGDLRSVPAELEACSAEAWVCATTQDPALTALLRAMLRLATYTGDLNCIGAAPALRQLAQASRHGVLYLDGGWQSLVNGLAAVCEASGVRVRTSAAVVSASSGCVTLRGGEVVRADAVVLAVPPTVVGRLLDGPAPTGHKAAVACLDVALSELPRATAPALGLDLDEGLYLSVHSSFARLAPQGGAMVQMLRYLDAASTDTTSTDAASSQAARSRALLEGLLERLQPGWRSRVVAEQFFPSITVTHGVPLAGTGGARPDIAAGVPGVWRVGDWVGPTGMLADASLGSAARVAEAITTTTAAAA